MNVTVMRILVCVFAFALLGQGFAQEQSMPAPSDAASEPLFKQEEIDQMLAPVALYPDALLAQVLMAATYPLEVVQAARWAKQNSTIKGDQLQAALQNQPWDPSVKSLVAFPQVLSAMDQDLNWTERLGEAFLAQKDQVMATVQDLRRKAQAAGSLRSTPTQNVIADDQYIDIEPPSPDVVYVPVYDPMVVYGGWWWPAYPPIYFAPPPGAVFASGFYWGLGISFGFGLWGHFDWHRHDVSIDVTNYNRFNRTRITSPHWDHDPGHRRFIQYRNPVLRERYGHVDQSGADARRNFRGFDGAAPPKGRDARAPIGKPGSVGEPRSGGRVSPPASPARADRPPTPSSASSIGRPTGGGQPRQPVARSGSGRSVTPHAFEGIDRGAAVRNLSERGRTSNQSAVNHGLSSGTGQRESHGQRR